MIAESINNLTLWKDGDERNKTKDNIIEKTAITGGFFYYAILPLDFLNSWCIIEYRRLKMRKIIFVVGALVLLSSNVLLDGPMGDTVPVHSYRVLAGLGLIGLGLGWKMVFRVGRALRHFWENPRYLVVKIVP